MTGVGVSDGYCKYSYCMTVAAELLVAETLSVLVCALAGCSPVASSWASVACTSMSVPANYHCLVCSTMRAELVAGFWLLG